ncbi:hypothetical protein ACFYNO_19125 [Kitasatospora sp. NPDC006697]|uniref:hypothetical protein n=1 Tax=Kitasatospora sp. NPDC006697 TaxID=3364020 RepID=UPI0036927304
MTHPRRTFALTASAAALALTLAACGSSGMAGMDMPRTSGSPAAPGTAMPGMDMSAPETDGLSDTLDGYRLTGLPATLPADRDSAVSFRITAPDGNPVTGYTPEQTEPLHFYAVRSDLTGFQHLHPTLAADGTWTAPLTAPQPGTWRFFTTFTPSSGPGQGKGYVLSSTVTVPGTAPASPTAPTAPTAPAPASPALTATTPDGYTVTAATPGGGELMAGMPHQLTITVSKDGKPVTDLQPYLETYAHLTAFRAQDLAFAHLHPQTQVTGDHGGPELTFQAELPKPGAWRLFLQFRTDDTLHTAALTLDAKG